jgi:hypothetical protein
MGTSVGGAIPSGRARNKTHRLVPGETTEKNDRFRDTREPLQIEALHHPTHRHFIAQLPASVRNGPTEPGDWAGLFVLGSHKNEATQRALRFLSSQQGPGFSRQGRDQRTDRALFAEARPRPPAVMSGLLWLDKRTVGSVRPVGFGTGLATALPDDDV